MYVFLDLEGLYQLNIRLAEQHWKKKKMCGGINSYSLTSCLIKACCDIFLQTNEIPCYLLIRFELTVPPQ